jgi:Zn-dependent membrane protease YugP
MPGDGITATLDFLQRQVDRLDNDKASKESVQSIREGLIEVRDAFDGLKRILIGASLSWVAGTGMFLLAVIQLVHS